MKSKQITNIALATAVTIVLSQIAIPLPFTVVPFTLSVFAIFLVSSILTPTHAVLAQVVYLFIGIIGIPVFSKFSGGFGVLIGPTGGFLLSYPIMAFVISVFSRKKKLYLTAISMVVALVICYAFGSIWFSVYTKKPFLDAAMLVVVPFVIPDLIKAAIATFVSTKIKISK